MRKIRTDEEKVARQISNLISSVSLDLDEIGIALATANPNVSYRRLQIIIESAEQEKESYNVADYNPLY